MYQLLRFRDDYRIFANDLSIISRIGKHLSEVLIELNLKLNSSKTFVSNDLISSAFKSDKLDWNAYKQTIDKEIIDKKNSMHQKQLLLIYSFAEKYPNSGSIMEALNKHYEKILKFDKQPQDIEQCISIVVEIAIKNPKVYAICSAIIGKYLGLIKSTKKAEQIANKVYKRISEQPNANYVEIWLYRAIFKVLPNKIDNFKSSLELYGETKNIWDSSWVNSGSNLYNVLQNSKIIDDEIKDAVEKYIDPKEINLFVY